MKRTDIPTGTLIKQPHGGALRNGGPVAVNNGGRPPSVLREELRGSFARRKHVLEDIADGEVIQKAALPLASILPHVECPNCGEIGVAAKDPSKVQLIQIQATVSANPNDRIKALDVLAKYGLGNAAKTVSEEEVRDRLAATIREIQTSLPVADAEALIQRIEKCWR